MEHYHVPVLLEESIDLLVTNLSGTYVDATFGGGGHTRKLLSRLNHDARLVAFDIDENAQKVALQLSHLDHRLTFFRENFSNLAETLESSGIDTINGAIFDLGVSSYQLDSESGFSYRRDDRLDMRLDHRLELTAYDVVNSYETTTLAEMFFKYGEEPKSRMLAKTITRMRSKSKIETTADLAEIVKRVCGKSVRSLSRVFQAIRIEVNRELESLSAGLAAAVDSVCVGGRIAALTYHSLEDRLVKETYKREASACICPPESIICTCGKIARLRIITRKPIVPSEEEIKLNRRARSAKLRVAEKIA